MSEKNEKQFPRGVNVKTVKTKYDDIIKIGINVETFKENLPNENGWVNFDIKKGKSGNWYAEMPQKQE